MDMGMVLAMVMDMETINTIKIDKVLPLIYHI